MENAETKPKGITSESVLDETVGKFSKRGEKVAIENLREENAYINLRDRDLYNILLGKNDDEERRKVLILVLKAEEAAAMNLSTVQRINLFKYFLRPGRPEEAEIPDTLKGLEPVIELMKKGISQIDSLQLPANWPKRKDGTPRYSIFPRLRLADVILENRESAETKIPEAISDLRKILEIVDKNPGIQAVSFDFMDTVTEWTCNVSERKAQIFAISVKILGEYGIKISLEEYKAVRDKIWYGFKERHRVEGTDFKTKDALREIVKAVAKDKNAKLKDRNLEYITGAMEDGIYKAEKKGMIRTPNIIKTLVELKKRGKKIVLLSNTPFAKGHVVDSLRQMDIEGFFDHILVSSEIGFQKCPDFPNAFNKIAEVTRCRPGEILHVGDSKQDDFEGAKNAGLNTTHFDNPNALKKLDKVGKNDSGRKTIEMLEQSMSNNASEYLDEQFRSSGETLHPRVAKVLQRGYEVGRELYGELMCHFCDDILMKNLKGKPMAMCYCTGRDALAMYIVLHRLVMLDPERYEGIKPEQIGFINISRKVGQKALKDGGFEYKVGREGEAKYRLNLDKTECEGYKDMLRTYFNQAGREGGFDKASDIVLIDSGQEGSIASTLMALYPDKAPNMEARYLYSYRKKEDPYHEKKSGFIWEMHGGGSGKGFNSKLVRGDRIFGDQNTIYFTEDLFNGAFTSNGHLDIAEGGKVKPRIGTLTPAGVCINPDKIPDEFRTQTTYTNLKKMIIRGIVDATYLYTRKRALDPDGQKRLLPDVKETTAKWADYLQDFVSFRRKNANKYDTEDQLLSRFVREIGYKDHEEEYARLWKKILSNNP